MENKFIFTYNKYSEVGCPIKMPFEAVFVLYLSAVFEIMMNEKIELRHLFILF